MSERREIDLGAGWAHNQPFMVEDPDIASANRTARWLASAVSKAAALLILIGLSAGTGALLAPSVLDQSAPYGDDGLGQLATQAVRLTRDYDVTDPDATERRRRDRGGGGTPGATTTTGSC